MAAHRDPVKGFVSGGFGGLCALLVGHPLDTVKVRLQTMPPPAAGQPPQFSGMLDCIGKTLRREGFLGLYRGMGAPFVSVVPVFACCFFGYNLGTKLVLAAGPRPDAALTRADVLGAGMFAGVFTAAIMAPTERIKCLLQVQTERRGAAFSGPWDAARQLYRRGGLRNLFVGSGATLLREIPSSGVFFVTNEAVRDGLRSLNGGGGPLTVPQIVVAGGVAGIGNWAVALPPDVLKSRLQTAPEGRYPHGLRSVLREVLANEGLLGLYRGAAPVMIRTFPTAGVCFLGYEMSMRFLERF